MKCTTTTLAALIAFTTACAPVDNDATAVMKTSNSTLAAETILKSLDNGPYDHLRIPDFDQVHGSMSEGALAETFGSDDGLLDVASNDGTNDNVHPVIDLRDNEGDTTIDSNVLSGEERLNAVHSECLALGFGGDTSGHILNSKPFNIDFAEGVTIEGWIRIDNDRGVILSKRNSELDPFWMVDYDDGQLRFTVGENASNRSVYAADFTAGEWFHFAIIRGEDVDGGALIFIDGQDETEQLEAGADTISVVNPFPVLIGKDTTGNGDDFRGGLATLHIAKGIWYSDDFDVETGSSTVESTIGSWDFTNLRDTTIQNEINDGPVVQLTGPIYAEHTTLCD